MNFVNLKPREEVELVRVFADSGEGALGLLCHQQLSHVMAY